VLVVGDSIVEQAADALRAESNSGVDVRVTDRLGTAPCDWTGGDFEAALAAAQPTVVVLAFSGNGGAAPGCVNDHTAYSLADLLNNYRAHLTDLANRATAFGAAVVFSTPPARNPLVPAPPAVPTAAESAKPIPFYGFQGVPQVRQLYIDMVRASHGQWQLSDAAALAVSPGFVFHQTLPCQPADGACPSGSVSVRKGGTDAIHLDPEGHGAWRFADALVSAGLAAINAPKGV
jgi:lysophospholipase L1-like esterase